MSVVNKNLNRHTEQKHGSEKVKSYEEGRIRKFLPSSVEKGIPRFACNDEKKGIVCAICHKYPTVTDKKSRLNMGISGSSNTGLRRD